MCRVKQEKGYALYLTLVLSFIIFLVLTQAFFYYLNQINMVQLKEDDLRAQTLLQAAVVLWTVEMRQRLAEIELDALEPEQARAELEARFIRQLPLEGEQDRLENGLVDFYPLSSLDLEYWHVRVSAKPVGSSTRHRVELTIDKKTGQIMEWTEKISKSNK